MYASISEGLWYARSEEFMQQPLFDTLRWGSFQYDVVFIFGALLSSANLYDDFL